MPHLCTQSFQTIILNHISFTGRHSPTHSDATTAAMSAMQNHQNRPLCATLGGIHRNGRLSSNAIAAEANAMTGNGRNLDVGSLTLGRIKTHRNNNLNRYVLRHNTISETKRTTTTLLSLSNSFFYFRIVSEIPLNGRTRIVSIRLDVIIEFITITKHRHRWEWPVRDMLCRTAHWTCLL